MNIERFLSGYTEAALWSSTDDDGEPLYGHFEIAPETLATMRADCEAFVEANAADLLAYAEHSHCTAARYTAVELAGHDFWLTRCGHGAGFWDRGMDELGDRLSDAAHAFGNVDLYVGDDGQVHA